MSRVASGIAEAALLIFEHWEVVCGLAEAALLIFGHWEVVSGIAEAALLIFGLAASIPQTPLVLRRLEASG